MDEEDGMDTRGDDEQLLWEAQSLLKDDAENYWRWLEGLDYPLNEEDRDG